MKPSVQPGLLQKLDQLQSYWWLDYPITQYSVSRQSACHGNELFRLVSFQELSHRSSDPVWLLPSAVPHGLPQPSAHLPAHRALDVSQPRRAFFGKVNIYLQVGRGQRLRPRHRKFLCNCCVFFSSQAHFSLCPFALLCFNDRFSYGANLVFNGCVFSKMIDARNQKTGLAKVMHDGRPQFWRYKLKKCAVVRCLCMTRKQCISLSLKHTNTYAHTCMHTTHTYTQGIRSSLKVRLCLCVITNWPGWQKIEWNAILCCVSVSNFPHRLTF